jgi:hypothetical protein
MWPGTSLRTGSGTAVALARGTVAVLSPALSLSMRLTTFATSASMDSAGTCD